MVKKETCNSCNGTNKIMRVIMGTAVILLFIFQAYFIFFMKDISNRALISNSIITLFALLAFVSSIRIYFKMPKNFPAEKKGYLLLTSSIFLFFLGDLLWLVYGLKDSLLPLGTWPDLAWSLAYFALIASLYYFNSLIFRESDKKLYMVLIIGIIIAGGILYLDVSEDLNLGSFSWQHAIQDSYILYDLIILILIIYIVWPMWLLKNPIFYSWIILGVGILSRGIYDRIFAELSESGAYYSGHLVDLIYIFFYIAIVFSNIYKCKMLDGYGKRDDKTSFN